uniref:Uncharacterized protein AlNc14C144G7332 n=1 Tax=Albugo laibachii Nc14 TaxID=890382 RepID=F0WLE4_9STRA|nr:conserved hypothetical protein [Albugo laibachii Nc14]CCA23401.1 conserved hypothetical protein [Albugo laibachii Nc14]|eukprot:CCA23401.1 conserved hypothetical protein [Albugo laibachii Nc14]
MNEDLDANLYPPPWIDMKAESYIFMTYTRSIDRIPDSWSDPFRSTLTSSPQNRRYIGGIGTIMIIRYFEAPCGPYDELMFCPGKFTVPALQNKSKFGITRIYVSTEASVQSGRANWGIPKQLAKFRFYKSRDCLSQLSDHVEVSSVNGNNPFFSMRLQKKLTFISLPVNTAYIPLDLELVHPPLTIADGVQITEKSISVNPCIRGWFSFVAGEGNLKDGKWGDGNSFPDICPISVGFYSSAMVVSFPVGKKYTVKQSKTA